ncbi:MAG TPA: PLP-dependent transferase [Thermoanaerobaculia bacterium]|nr:PLP-dependent transferase [Thermoanaerobaculia bacterium]
MRFETIAVHAGGETDPASGAIAPPIQLSTTFEHGPAGEVPLGHLYIRESNPTQARLEAALAAIEGGEAALVFASGMAAGAAYLQALPAGSHVIFHTDLYYGFRIIAQEFLPRWDLTASAVDLADEGALRAALRPETRLIWAETPTNPLLDVLDLGAIAAIARGAGKGGASLIVDGTFATPALQRPLELGADAVLHSTTKYLGGHSDVQGGALIFKRRDETGERVAHIRHILGAVGSPFNSWLVLRGLRTLACRVERQAANALAVARALAGHSGVTAVHYPGLPSHPGHEIARRQMRAFGGMLSLRVAGGREGAIRAASRLKLFTNATSLGGTESLIEHRASSEGPGSTTPQDLLRASIGLEHPDDLVEDLFQALG